MSNYQRLEINLLPPEMAPSPAVRGSVIMSFAIGLFAAALLLVNLWWSYAEMSRLDATNKQKEAEILKAKTDEEKYDALKEIQDNIEGRGKLIGMTTAGYIEYPLIMDRVARILPDGVYLVKVGSTSASSVNPPIDLEFKTATNDASLIQRTLEAFKASSMFSECVLHQADFMQAPIDELKKSFDINYSFEGPGEGDAPTTQGYDFEIRAFIKSPLEIEDLPTVMDNSELMTQFTLASDPNAIPEQAPAGAAAPAGGAPATPPAAGAPAAGGGK